MKRSFLWLALVALVAGACGGGSDGGTTPPSQQTVATVEVSPTSGTIVIPGTLQLTATPRDASGSAVSGRTITWTSSATTVATVSSSGLVTSVAAGTATITAATDGKQGQATIAVNSAVASVDVTPPSANINLPGTLQLTAIPRDAQGVAITGRTIAWATSAPAVAAVSASGLVTAVAPGTAVMTASTDGKQGQATITVSASDYGPVVARADIGPSGGTVSSADVGVTIPAGAFTTTNTVMLARDTVSANAFPGNSASSTYVLDGIPAGVVVQTRVRVKYTGAFQGAAAIAVQRPAMESAEDLTVVMGTTLYAATDSSGYLVATIPIKGKPTTWTSPGMTIRAPALTKTSSLFSTEIDPHELKAAAELSGLMNLSHLVSGSGHFDVWGLGGTGDMAVKVAKAAQVAEAGFAQIATMGYSTAHRTTWPIEVFVRSMSAYGSWTSILPYPVDPNLGYISYNKNFVDDADFPGTVIHEIFHMVQGGFLLGKDWATASPSKWLGEATSTWIMEMHPQSPQPYASPIALSWKDSLFTGVAGGMVAKSGYGKAPIIKYIAKRWGNAKVREIYTLVGQGVTPIAAMMMSLPEQPEVWWPDLLNQHMGGSLYPWTMIQLIPKHRYDITLTAGDAQYTTDELPALGVEGELILRDTAKFGPNFTMPIALAPAFIGKAKILAYKKSAADALFQPVAGGDTVKIAGSMLQSKDLVMILITPTRPVAPYTATSEVGFHLDLSLPEADWRFPTITNVADGNHFVCDHPGDSVSLNVADNASSVWDFMAQAGTWKKVAGPPSSTATYKWAVDPALADTLAKFGIVMTSTLTQGNMDTLRFQGTLRMGVAPSINGGAIRKMPAGSGDLGWWWLVVPLSAVPFAFKRRTRPLVPVAAIASLLLLVSCGVGQISMSIDEAFDYTFTKMRFMANPAMPNEPLMQVYKGAGTTDLKSYRSEYWTYTTDATGAKTDSTRVVCTGSGKSTYTADGVAYTDGVKPPTTASTTDLTSIAARALGRDPAVVRKNMQLQRR